MSKPEATRPANTPAEVKVKKPYHAPLLREYGSLVKLTAKGTIGGDLSAKSFP